MTWSLTLAGLPRAGRKSKPHACKQNFKNEGPFENLGFNGKTVRGFRTLKRTETLLLTFQKNPVKHKDPKSIN